MSYITQVANLLDKLIVDLNIIESTDNMALAHEEFALGYPVQNRPLDLCFGHAPTTPRETYAPLVVGLGLIRCNDSVPTTVIPSGPDQSEFLFDPLANLSIPVQDCYAFGSIFVQTYIYSNILYKNIIMGMVESSLGTGSMLLISRNYDVNTALKLQNKNMIGNVVIPPTIEGATEIVNLELMKFVVDINYYNPENASLNDYRIYVNDNRLPRGWAGYADENMASILTPTLITYYMSNLNQTSNINNAIKDLINTWASSPSWNPDFITYWRTQNTLPDNLRAYLNSIGWVV